MLHRFSTSCPVVRQDFVLLRVGRCALLILPAARRSPARPLRGRLGPRPGCGLLASLMIIPRRSRLWPPLCVRGGLRLPALLCLPKRPGLPWEPCWCVTAPAVAEPPDSSPPVPTEHYDFAQFPEYTQLKHHERMLRTVTSGNPYFRADQGGAGSMAHIDGRQLVNFCVYDYVGMARDSEVAAAAKAAIDHYGTGHGWCRARKRCIVILSRL